jgi:hypothetical protein
MWFFFSAAQTTHFQIMIKEKPTKCIFKVNHILYLEYQSCSYMLPHTLCYCSYFITHYITSFINILTTDIPTFYIFSQCIFYFNFSTYDIVYAQFHQDPLGSLKMVLLQRRNM